MNKVKTRVSGVSSFANAEKKSKKSKHGKKNWRKNIDVQELEDRLNKLEQEKLIDKNLHYAKDEELFVIDVEPKSGVKLKQSSNLLNKKTNRKKNQFSKVEDRKIKRIVNNISQNKELDTQTDVLNVIKRDKMKLNPQVYDLWGDNTNSSTIKNPSQLQSQVNFPKVPLPHPGQSYNPSRGDLTILLNKIVDLNKISVSSHIDVHNTVDNLKKSPPNSPRGKEISKEISDEEYESDSDSECKSEQSENNFTPYIANNPAVDDTQRKTKKEKKRKIQAKLNSIKQKEFVVKKENRIKLANAKATKTIEKEREKKLKSIEEIKKKEKELKKEKEELLLTGIIEDKELLKDFPTTKELPLRKMKTKVNALSERYENILMRNILGGFDKQTMQKRNRKLSKLKYKDGFGGDYGLGDDSEEKLKIFE